MSDLLDLLELLITCEYPGRVVDKLLVTVLIRLVQAQLKAVIIDQNLSAELP